MNMPIPDFKQQILGYGGAASMVHPASGYLIGNVLRRAPLVAKAVSEAIKNKNLSTYHIARKTVTIIRSSSSMKMSVSVDAESMLLKILNTCQVMNN